MGNRRIDALSMRGRSQDIRNKSMGSKSPKKYLKKLCLICGKARHFKKDCRLKKVLKEVRV
jgi:hypothetical protein